MLCCYGQHWYQWFMGELLRWQVEVKMLYKLKLKLKCLTLKNGGVRKTVTYLHKLHHTNAMLVNHCLCFAVETLTGPPVVPRTTVSERASPEWKTSTYHLCRAAAWSVNLALPSILYISHELAAISCTYNGLFVMTHKPINMIITDCSEPLRVTIEEV